MEPTPSQRAPFRERMRRSLWKWSALIGCIVLLYVCRQPILRCVGDLLIAEDELVHADAVYVLGGAPRERGAKGAELVMEGWAPVLIATGSNIPGVMEGEGLFITEAELTARAAQRAGLDSTRIRRSVEGTSTWEESSVIKADASAHGYDTILVVSTEFHLSRVRRVFRKQFNGSAIEVRTVAAPSLNYDAKAWWTSEEGLLMVNNEYVKSIYYFITY